MKVERSLIMQRVSLLQQQVIGIHHVGVIELEVTDQQVNPWVSCSRSGSTSPDDDRKGIDHGLT
jgi:hypothetical protein